MCYLTKKTFTDEFEDKYLEREVKVYHPFVTG